jgi:hypothetical protein
VFCLLLGGNLVVDQVGDKAYLSCSCVYIFFKWLLLWSLKIKNKMLDKPKIR